MGAGFLALIFNPYAWVVVAAMTVASFSGGVVKGWNWSNADKWRLQAEALEKAGRQKDELIRADVDRAEADRVELARLEENLDVIVHTPLEPLPVPPGTVPAAAASTPCRMSLHELEQLRGLATGNGSRLR